MEHSGRCTIDALGPAVRTAGVPRRSRGPASRSARRIHVGLDGPCTMVEYVAGRYIAHRTRRSNDATPDRRAMFRLTESVRIDRPCAEVWAMLD